MPRTVYIGEILERLRLRAALSQIDLLVWRDDEQVRAHEYRDQQSHPALSVLVLGFGAI